MMTFVNMDAPGLVILPTYRVVFGLENFSIFEMVSKLQVNFEVEDIGPLPEIEGALERLRQAGQDRTALLAVTSHGGFLLRSRPGIQWNGATGLSERQRALDVVQLHKLVLEEALGLSEEDIRDQKHLRYHRDAREAVNEVAPRRQCGVPHESRSHGAGTRHRLWRRSAAAEVHRLLSQAAERARRLLAGGGRHQARRREGIRLLLSGRVSRLILALIAVGAVLLTALLLRRAPVHAQSPEQNQLTVYSPQTSYSVPLLEVKGQLYAGLVELLEPSGIGGRAA